jgi:parallel beta-helix repeat protein
MYRLRPPAYLVAPLCAIGLGFGLGAQPATAAVSCDLVAAPGGSDSAAGTVTAPFATAQRLVASLASGQTGCFRAGSYSWSGDLSIRTAGSTVASYPGELATLQGRLRIERTATGAAVEGLKLNVRNANNYSGLQIYADRAVLRGNEITNEHADAVCIVISSFYSEPAPTRVLIEGNRIHDCGITGTNQRHGIYVAQATDTVIRDNWIYDNADRGIQLYPNSDGALVTGNVIDSNGEGVFFGGDGTQSSDNNVVKHNLITNSKIRHNVESYWSGPVGSGNVVRDNCVFGGAQRSSGGGIQSPQVGFSSSANTIANPQYVKRRTGDYRLREGSPCAAILDP